MDEFSDPAHIFPIFSDLLERQFLGRAGLKLSAHLFFPPNGYQLTRKPAACILRLAVAVFDGHALVDHHMLVIVRAN